MGRRGTPLYTVWSRMKERCYNKNDAAYKNYGGRGIYVCDEWKNDYLAFHEWALSSGYEYGLSIDRIDNNGPYSPENCRWATRKEQCNNRRTNLLVTYNGETKTFSQWIEEYNADYDLVFQRYKKLHWDFGKALTTPPEDWNITINGESHCLAEWARIKGLNLGSVASRIYRGWSKEDAIMRPMRKY